MTALLLAGSGLVLLWQSYLPESRPPAARLLADSHGKIELAVVSVNSARSSSLRNADLTSTIVNRLPASARILILASDREAFSVASNPWPDRVRFVEMPADYRLTIWPQDPFVVLRDDRGPRLLPSPGFARADDREMARVLADHLELPLDHASLTFEGGNLVADETHVFIGANTVRYNALEKNLDETEVVRRFQQELGKPVIVVGPAPQPIGHVDMMLTPLGGQRLLLADPGWGARLAQEDLEQDPAAVLAFERRSENNFFGLPDVTELTALDGSAIRAPQIEGSSQLAITDSRAIAGALDQLAASLQQLGFDVMRVPYLQRNLEWPETMADGETIPADPGYPQITYNNVLLESVDGQQTVYLPTYGWERLDNAAIETWRQLGYRVVAVPGFTTTAMYGGALRCSVKVLARH